MFWFEYLIVIKSYYYYIGLFAETSVVKWVAVYKTIQGPKLMNWWGRWTGSNPLSIQILINPYKSLTLNQWLMTWTGQRPLQFMKFCSTESEDVLDRIEGVNTTAACQEYCQQNPGRHFSRGVHRNFSRWNLDFLLLGGPDKPGNHRFHWSGGGRGL